MGSYQQQLYSAELLLKERYDALLKVKLPGIVRPSPSYGTSNNLREEVKEADDKARATTPTPPPASSARPTYGINTKKAMSAADAAKLLGRTGAAATLKKQAEAESEAKRARREEILAREREAAKEKTRVRLKLSQKKRPPAHQGDAADASKRPRSSIASLPLPELNESGFVWKNQPWDSREAPSALIVPLPGYEPEGHSTVAVYGRMPSGASRFALNIAPGTLADEKNVETVYFYHFNPRIWKGKKSIVQGAFFGNAWQKIKDADAIKTWPFEFDVPFCIEIYMSKKLFVVSMNGKYLGMCQLAGDAVLNKDATLHLIVPTVETTWGDPESIVVDKVWFGRKELTGEAKRNFAVTSASIQESEGELVTASAVNIAKGGKTTIGICGVEGLPRDGRAKSVMRILLQGYAVKYGYGGLMVSVNDAQGTSIIHFKQDTDVERFVGVYDGQYNEAAGSILRATRALRLPPKSK